MTTMEPTHKTKVLFLITKGNWGGAQRYVYDLATNLPPEQYEVAVAVGEAGPLTQKLAAAGIPVHSLANLQRDVSLKKELDTLRETARLIRTEAPQILHVNSSKAGFIGAILGRFLGVPQVIFTCHGWAFNEDRPLWQRLTFQLIHWLTVLASHRTITVSDAVRSQMHWPLPHGRMRTVRNGGTAPDFLSRDDARAALSLLVPPLDAVKADTWLISIGELHRTKQHHVTIAALAELRARGTHTPRLIIFGEGEERTRLTALVTTHGLSEHVFFLGHVPEAARYLKAADCFVLASRSEALGYVVLEAAQAAVPIVATRVGGIPEVVTDRYEARLVAEGDPAALASAIAEVLSDTPAAMAMAERAHAHSQTFTTARMVQETIAIYGR
jgi:glycosyltransferase involved in cell wall biosynthesis